MSLGEYQIALGRKEIMKHLKVVSLGIFLLLALACTSTPLHLQTAPVGPDEQVFGPVEGSSTGIMLFHFIPINQNNRFVSAYQQAVATRGGTTRLVDVTMQERWFWAWLLNGYIFHVSGTAVGPKQEK